MNSELQEVCRELRAMKSNQAASWLMNTYPVTDPDYGDAFQLLRARSWKRAEQLLLARYYLSKTPFASPKPYEAFASFMSLQLLTTVLREHLPKSKSDIDLLAYHLRAVLRNAARTSDDREAVESFLADLSQESLNQENR